MENMKQLLIDDPEIHAQMLEKSFSPSSPINDAALFAGRKEQRRDITLAVNQEGQHVIVFGQRGVGKTSLALILERQYQTLPGTIAVRLNCEAGDTFDGLWEKTFQEIGFQEERLSAGFLSGSTQHGRTLADVAGKVNSNEIRRVLNGYLPGKRFVIIFDEFDRLDVAASAPFADLIKTFSDHTVPVTLILVGVADNVDALMKEHSSIERALVQIQMPRMSEEELKEIVTGGLTRAAMTIGAAEVDEIARLSQGLPHYTHLLGLLAGREALDSSRSEVAHADVEAAIFKGVEKAQESIKSAHYEATVSAHKDSLFKQVLLACAMTNPDLKGTFAASDVRNPMSRIMKKKFEIPAFSQHLSDFCDKRGPVLEKLGESRRYRFRFRNPLMQPYVIMHGLKSGLIEQKSISGDE